MGWYDSPDQWYAKRASRAGRFLSTPRAMRNSGWGFGVKVVGVIVVGVLAVWLAVYIEGKNKRHARHALEQQGIEVRSLSSDLLSAWECAKSDSVYDFTGRMDGRFVDGVVCCSPMGRCHVRF